MNDKFTQFRNWFVGTKLARSYRSVGLIVARYWRAYGGWSDLLTSVYFHVAIVIASLSYGFWMTAGWWDLVISIVPSLLGFTLGGYALLIAFLGEGFRKFISGPKTRPDGTQAESPFIVMNATFAHYIVVQMFALTFAALSKTCHGTESHSLLSAISLVTGITGNILGYAALVFWGISFLLFAYSITLSAAAAFAVFRVGTWIDKHSSNNDEVASNSIANAASTNLPHVQAGVRVAPTALGPATTASTQAELEMAEAEAEAAMKAKAARTRKN